MALTKIELADKAFTDGTVDQLLYLGTEPDTVVQRWRVGDVCFTHTSPGAADVTVAFGVTALDPAVGWKHGVQVLGKTIVGVEEAAVLE